MIRATYDIATKGLQVGDQSYDGEAALSQLRELVAKEDPDTEVTLLQAGGPCVVFSDGWNRHVGGWFPWGLADLDAHASKMADRPVLMHHDRDERVMGRGGEGSAPEVEGRKVLAQDIHVTGRRALQDLCAGADVSFSIGVLETAQSQMLCSLCRAPLAECDHFVGDVDEETGARFQVLLTDTDHAETSIEVYPACEGTGSHGARAPQIRVPRDLQLRAQRIRFATQFSAELGEARTAQAAAEKARMQAEADLVAARAQADRLEAEKADRRILEARAEKGLIGDHAEMVADYRANSDLAERWIKRMPDSAIARVLSPAPAQYRDEDLTPQTEAEQLAAEVSQICAADPKRDRAQVWRECRPKYNGL
jgi:hypothetical protein